jgi:hypothetical protein
MFPTRVRKQQQTKNQGMSEWRRNKNIMKEMKETKRFKEGDRFKELFFETER